MGRRDKKATKEKEVPINGGNCKWWIDRGLDGYRLVLKEDIKEMRVQNKKHISIIKFEISSDPMISSSPLINVSYMFIFIFYYEMTDDA